MNEYILAFDFGTTSLKTVLFSRELQTIASASREYQTSYPHSDWAEHDPSDWWKALVETANEVVHKSGVDPKDVKVISIDAMTPVLVAVDEMGNALRPAIIWMDRRAQEQCVKIDMALGDRLFEVNGNHNDPSNFAPKIMWLKDYEPEVYDKAHKFLYATSYLVNRLTGKMVVDKTQCGLSQLCDTKTSQWSPELIRGCGIDPDKLPEIVESTHIVGGLTNSSASQLGLTEDTVVLAGAMDNVAAGLGLGVYDDGQVYISAGTASNGCVCSSTPLYDGALHVYHHIVPGRWLSVAGVDYGGAGLKWFNNLMGNNSIEDLVKKVERKADINALKPLMFLPYMVGQRAPLWNTHTRGNIFGLDPAVDDADLANMFMEGNALGVKRIFDIVEHLGLKPREVMLTGGCSKSEYYSQVFCDVTGYPVSVAGDSDVASLGMAMAAAYAMGYYDSFSEMTKLVKIRAQYTPDNKRVAYYKDMYKLFKSLYNSLEDHYSELNEIRYKYYKQEEKTV